MPALISPDGREYRTSDRLEIKRLTLGFGYTEKSDTFHPADHTVTEVVQYMKDHPEEADRIRAEELSAEKPRKTITGEDPAEGESGA